MSAIFRINRLGAQDNRSINFDEFLNEDIFNEICFLSLGHREYTVDWIDERNIGRYITLEENGFKKYILLSVYGEVRARNSSLQSVSTAYSRYLADSEENKKIEFYFLPYNGNLVTDYLIFMYRIMKTIGVKFLNFPETDANLTSFVSPRQIVTERNLNRRRNNNPSFITDENEYYHVYGKTHGANGKEAVLLGYALSIVSSKNIKFFQILDNGSSQISDFDREGVESLGKIQFIFINDTIDSITYEESSDEGEQTSIRKAIFIYNMLEKFGEKKCALCDCSIDHIIQAAHIWPVASIRKSELSLDEKIMHANNGDNGLWLCENHHKLFDRNLIEFRDGYVVYSRMLEGTDMDYITEITKYEYLDEGFLNENTRYYFNKRNES